MLHRCQKGRQRLSREGTSALRRKRQGKHDRQICLMFLQNHLRCLQARLDIQGVEGCLKQDDIHTTFYQCRNLLLVGCIQIGVGHSTIGWIAHVRTHGSGLIGRAYRSCHPNRATRSCRIGIGCLTHQTCSCPIDLAHIGLCTIISHRDHIGIKRISRDNVCPCLHILRVNLFQHIGPGDVQEVIIAFQLSGEIRESFPSIILFCQFKPLDHGAQPSVEH